MVLKFVTPSTGHTELGPNHKHSPAIWASGHPRHLPSLSSFHLLSLTHMPGPVQDTLENRLGTAAGQRLAEFVVLGWWDGRMRKDWHVSTMWLQVVTCAMEELHSAVTGHHKVCAWVGIENGKRRCLWSDICHRAGTRVNTIQEREDRQVLLGGGCRQRKSLLETQRRWAGHGGCDWGWWNGKDQVTEGLGISTQNYICPKATGGHWRVFSKKDTESCVLYKFSESKLRMYQSLPDLHQNLESEIMS